MNSSPTNAFGRRTLASQIAGRAGDVFGKRAWKITPPRGGRVNIAAGHRFATT